MTTLDWILIGAIVVMMLLPPRFDPAIRLKEWMIRKGWSKW